MRCKTRNANTEQTSLNFQKMSYPILHGYKLVRKKIGAIAIPDKIQWTRDLPKTRSGKIMRRILRKNCLWRNRKFRRSVNFNQP